MNNMQGFEQIVGHNEIIEHLQNSIAYKKVSHSYLFEGQAGSGKKLLANLFAMTLQCEEKGTDPCLTCTSCKKALSKNHPDIKTVMHGKPNSIGIDDIREQLLDDIVIRPYEGQYKIYIIPDAHKMTLQAQNALLKTIEEPPAYAVIILLTDNVGAMLPTVMSRCVHLRLKPVGDQLVKEYLMNSLNIPEFQAEMQASAAQGNIGRAIELSESNEFSELSQSAIYLLKKTKDTTVYELVDQIKMLTENKNLIFDYLEVFTMWFRDVLLFKATKELDGIIFKDQANAIRERAVVSSYEGLEIILEAIRTAEARLRANVNFELTMELLFLTIREY